MKVIVVLLVTLALAQGPAFGELSDSDVTRMEQMMNAALAPVIAELNELKAELQAVKTELAALKNDVSELKGEVRQQGNRITSLESRMNSQTNALLLVAGLLVTVLLWMLKQQWDARREDNKTITSQQETIVAMQAEIERLKLGIVTGQGKPATDNVAS